MGTKELICDECKKKFTCIGTPEEMIKEAKENFGNDIIVDDMAVICDECYNEIMKK